MSEFLGTKGIWKITNSIPNGLNDLKEHIEIATDEWSVACVFTDVYGEEKEAKANALLISKSREMLEMLQTISQLQKDTDGDASGLHVTMIGISKQIDKLIKEATTLCETK